MSRFAFLFAAAILLNATFASAAAIITPSSDPGNTSGDLFDITTGATVTASSPLISGGANSAAVDATDLIGAVHTDNVEGGGHILFADNNGSTDSVTIQTPSPVTINKVNLWLSEDGNGSGNRSVKSFSLTVDGNPVDTVSIIPSGSSYTSVYGSSFIEVTDTFATVTGSTFVATFGVNINGPRVYELDGIATPEPSSLAALAGLAAMGVAMMVRRHRKA